MNNQFTYLGAIARKEYIKAMLNVIYFCVEYKSFSEDSLIKLLMLFSPVISNDNLANSGI